MNVRCIYARMQRILDEYEDQERLADVSNDGNNNMKRDAEAVPKTYMGIRTSPDTSILSYNFGATNPSDGEVPIKRAKRISRIAALNQRAVRKEPSAKPNASSSRVKKAIVQPAVRKQPLRLSKSCSPYGAGKKS